MILVRLLKFLFALSFLGINLSSAIACSDHEYEQCVGPACWCMPKGPPVPDVASTTKRIIDDLASELGKSPKAIEACLVDVKKCAVEIMSAPLAAPIQSYLDDLYKKTASTALHFSPEFLNLVQPYYSVDISSVTWADVDTGVGMSISYCDRIFLNNVASDAWSDRATLSHMLHELEHIVQCRGRGKSTYLAEYVLKASYDVVRSGKFNVHDVHDYEVSAENKAQTLTPVLWAQIQSGAVAKPKWPSGTVARACECYAMIPTAEGSEPRCVSQLVEPRGCTNLCGNGIRAYGWVCK